MRLHEFGRGYFTTAVPVGWSGALVWFQTFWEMAFPYQAYCDVPVSVVSINQKV